NPSSSSFGESRHKRKSSLSIRHDIRSFIVLIPHLSLPRRSWGRGLFPGSIRHCAKQGMRRSTGEFRIFREADCARSKDSEQTQAVANRKHIPLLSRGGVDARFKKHRRSLFLCAQTGWCWFKNNSWAAPPRPRPSKEAVAIFFLVSRPPLLSRG